MTKKITFIISSIFVSILLISWGSVGHKKINLNATLSFNQQMSQFLSWGSQLSSHASDADNRKDTDPTESPKHYIDIDNYSTFLTQNRIYQTWDSVIAAYGYSFVMNEGILPWATVTTVDTLRQCFQRKDWNKAILTASDLGHYVGDGHMPLHITKNYDGQQTGNSGIHSRYESTMISNYNYQIVYSGDTNLQLIQNVNQYVFNYIYNNYKYKDSVLLADNYAKTIAGNTTSSTYTLNLWGKTQYFTTLLFKNASHALAELIYTAWVQAGSPELTPSDVNELIRDKDYLAVDVYPNPFSEYADINVNLKKDSKNLTIEIFDMQGRLIKVITKGNLLKGDYHFNIALNDVPRSYYFCVLKTDESEKSIKILKLN